MRKRCLRVLICLFIAFIMPSCSSNDSKEYISKVLGIDLSNGTVSEKMDSHGGFHGDGIKYIEITFSREDSKHITEAIQNNQGWNKLPLSQNLNIALYGKKSLSQSIGPYITNDNSKPIFPRVKNGYYFLLIDTERVKMKKMIQS